MKLVERVYIQYILPSISTGKTQEILGERMENRNGKEGKGNRIEYGNIEGWGW